MLASTKGFVFLLAICAIVLVYLFVSAPAPLPEANARDTAEVSVKELLQLCAAENAAVRELYTKRIVGAGKQAGLMFDEKWRNADVEAGPLPALFLREAAKSLEKDPVPLALFLGSDRPINRANLFQGRQAIAFEQMRIDRNEQHFFVAELGLYTGMFPDLAVAPACVTCHNEHPHTAKNDWKLDDVMGATTWTYPKASASLSETLDVLRALRRGFRDAYTVYVEKSKTFASPPTIGDRWPEGGYYLPSPDVFMREAELQSSAGSMRGLLRVR